MQQLPLHCLQLRPLLLRLLLFVALQAWSLSAYALNVYNFLIVTQRALVGRRQSGIAFAYPHAISFWRLKRFLQRTFVVLDATFDLLLFDATHYAAQPSRGVRKSRKIRSQRPPVGVSVT